MFTRKSLVYVVTSLMLVFSASSGLLAATTENIVAKALTHEGQIGWSCKEFVQHVFSDIGGQVGTGYRNCYLNYGFVEVTSLQPGDVIQTSNPALNHEWDDTDLNNDDKSDYPYHSAIYEGPVDNQPGYYWVVDSNFHDPPDFTVRHHNAWNPTNYVATKPGHQVYFYRLMVGRQLTNTICRPILEAYYEHGGKQTFGLPVALTISGQFCPATVWEWELCYVQVFNGGELNECAIVLDRYASPTQAFPMHGQLWWFYKAYNGPYLTLSGNLRIGGPVDWERYATNNYNGHLLVVQKMANGWLVYDTVTGFADAQSGSGGFTIAVVPPSSPTPALTVSATALSPTSIQVTGNQIGQATTEVYLDGSYVGQLSDSQRKWVS